MKRWLVFTGSALALTGIALMLIAWSVPSMADQQRNDGGRAKQEQHDDQHDGPNAIWSVPKVDVILKPGQSTTTTVTLTAQDDLDAAGTWITPSLVPYLTVSPTTTPRLKKGQTKQFTLTFETKIDALPTATTGVLQLREREDKGRLGEVVAKPLSVSFGIAWKSTVVGSGIVVKIPGTLAVDPRSPINTAILVPANLTANDREHDVPSIDVEEMLNPNGLTFGQFFDGVHSDDNWASMGSAISTTSVQGRSAFKVDDGSMYITVVIPKSRSFIVVTDGGMAYQASGEFQTVLDNLTLGAP